MKKYLIGMLVFALGLQMKASDNVKVFNINRFDEPVVSVINTDNQFDYLVIKDASNDMVLMEKSIKNQLNIQHRLDFIEGGAKNYTIELVNKNEDLSTELEVVNNNIIQKRVEVSEANSNKVKMFILEDDNLLLSHINGNEDSLFLVIQEKGTNKRFMERSVGNDLMFSRIEDISRLKEGTNYRVTLYSGQTAYYYDFVK